MKNCVFTIVAKNYIGVAQILEQSLSTTNPNIDFFIFVADEFDISYDISKLPKNVHICRNILEITEQMWVDMSFKYDLTEFCTAIKPACYKYLLTNTDHDKIIFLDPDIFAFSSFEPIFELLDQHDIVVTPHLSIIRDKYQGEISENGLMGTGVFNLGFCAIRRGQIADKLLAWWHNKLIERCYIDQYNTLFTDQKWMDFLPCFFDSKQLHVARHLGMNIAPWNFFERKILKKDGVLLVCPREEDQNNEDKILSVIFVHYSGYNYKALKNGSVVQNNIKTLNNYEDIALLTTTYSKALSANKEGFDKYIDENYSYSKFENGDDIKSFHRRIYRSLTNKGELIPKPFSTGDLTLHSSFNSLGMTKSNSFNVDKVTVGNLEGVGNKLKLFNKVMRLVYKVIGFERYLLLIRLFKPYSRYESQIHLFNKNYDSENISL